MFYSGQEVGPSAGVFVVKKHGVCNETLGHLQSF